jgi:hypothetical protein
MSHFTHQKEFEVWYFGGLKYALTCLAIFSATESSSEAAAKKPPPVSCEVQRTVANPIRPVVVLPVGTQVFQLPNGRPANFQADLQSMLTTAVTNLTNFAPTEYDPLVPPRPCDSHLELKATVSSFQLDAVQLGFSIGFNPQGTIPLVTGVTGKTQLNVGNISMDFAVLSCSQGVCTSIAASSANHVAVGGSISLEVDFGMISLGPQLLLNTPLGDIMRKIISLGVTSLGVSNHLNEIPWQATVREYIPATQLLIFDAGNQSQIGVNQVFEIYAPAQGYHVDACQVFQVLAYAHTTAVNAVSSVAQVDKIVGTRSGFSSSSGDPIQPGDLVMIHVGAIP